MTNETSISEIETKYLTEDNRPQSKERAILAYVIASLGRIDRNLSIMFDKEPQTAKDIGMVSTPGIIIEKKLEKIEDMIGEKFRDLQEFNESLGEMLEKNK